MSVINRSPQPIPQCLDAPSAPPELAGLPVIGSLLDLRRDPLGTFMKAQREHGDVVRLTAGPPGLRSVFYAVFSPEGIQQVLGTQAANFRKDHPLYEEIRQTFGNGLLTSQDTDYVRQRRLVQPLFNKRRVDGYATAMTIEADLIAARWRAVEDRTVDLVQEMNRLALHTVARILFGLDLEAAVPTIHRSLPLLSAYVARRAYAPLK
ncbi:cytochrome P450, partial [Streptomyces sp. YS-3]|uniref:cytochrome P450 n=1 Tax=Streptomyces sp. YS-3 TaxID=3381352 RepID=UPI00386248BA